MRLRRLIAACAGLACLAGFSDLTARDAAAQSTPSTRVIKDYEKFQAWSRAVQAHEPGQFDAPAREVDRSSLIDLDVTAADLSALAKLLATASPQRRSVRYEQPAPPGKEKLGFFRVMYLQEVPALLGLPADRRLNWDATGSRGDLMSVASGFDEAVQQLRVQVSRVMKAAAVLHTDIAVFTPPVGEAVDRRLSAYGFQAGIVQTSDARNLGAADIPIHWQLGRAALAVIPRGTPADPFVLQWYRATSAYQEAQRHYGYAGAHLREGIARFDADAPLQFYAGVLLENLAAPPVQVFLRDEGLTNRFAASPFGRSIPNAEVAYRRALELDAGLHGARLHLGRVLGLAGRHEESSTELRRVLPALTDASDQYYAQLFLGAAEQALGRLDAARDAFAAARALFPSAQSPYLGLSQVAWQRDDRAAARTAFVGVAALPPLEVERVDPWWSYDIAPVANAVDLLNDVREQVRRERKQER